MGIDFPGLFAGQKDHGKVPTAHGEITAWATPEPDEASPGI